MKRAVALFIAALAVAVSCAHAQAPSSAPASTETPLWQTPPKIEADGDTLVYDGFLNADGAQRAVPLIASGRFRQLRIESGGGEIMSSMRIGMAVFERRMDVVVRNICLSSCANYVFPAGARKLIEADSIVAWHGDARQPNTLLRIELLKEWEQSLGRGAVSAHDRQWIADMRERIAAQDAYYARIGVRDGIARLGHEVLPVTNGFWALPVRDMAQFGIARLEAPADYGSRAYCERVKIAQRIPALTCLGLEQPEIQRWLRTLESRPRVSP